MYLIKKLKSGSLVSIVIAAIICLAASTLHAATINVTTTTDELINNSQCSLREAIINANNNAATYPDCPAGSGADTINLPGGPPYTLSIVGCIGEITVGTQGDLDITDSLTIVGAGADTTIIEGDGSFDDRIIDIFYFGTGGPFTVEISDVTIRRGNATVCAGEDQGGGIRIATEATFDVTLNRVVVTENNAAALGGGIYNGPNNNGSLTINSSTIGGQNNSGRDGGGIAAVENMTLINSTISGNNAELNGGGIYFAGDLTTLNLRNVTVTNNTVNTGDGGGVAVQAQQVQLIPRNTIIAGNTDNDNSAPDCWNTILGLINSEGYNLIGDNSGCNTTWDATDQIGVDPLLGPLANNGGPTPTHALDPQSPAVDKANDVQGCTSNDAQTVVLNDDQRGEPRPEDADGDGNAVCDVGAYELQGVCGDGIIQPPDEECDDGANNSDTEPDACRIDCTLPSCGDGVVDTGEGCDDGNTVDGDGCSATCVLETCGDGVLHEGEDCDDGADNSDTVADACRTNCLLPSCGDGVVDSGEECDDGNNVDGDGCTSTCLEELVVLLGDGGCNLTAATTASSPNGVVLISGMLITLALLRRRFF